jgi:hypothetical protein
LVKSYVVTPTSLVEVTSDPHLLLPAGTRLVHIGFPKTGTTSLQYALDTTRSQLAEYGVAYPGKERYHKAAGVYISQAIPRRGDPPVKESDWTTLVQQTHDAAEMRVMISSEWLSETPLDGIERLVHDLGGVGNVHIVATLRPLVKIMPSAWQQYLQNGNRVPYEKWLKGMLVTAPYEWPTPSFWRRHRHGEILSRWAQVAGPENVTAIVVDSRDHGLLLRQFESLLGLPHEFLQPQPPDKDNRSLSWPEAEMLRLVNKTVRERDWPDSVFRSIVRLGVVERMTRMRTGADDLPKIGMPTWAAEKASALGAEFAATIDGLGIRVIGDVDSLGQMPGNDETRARPPAMVPAEIAAEAILAAIQTSIEYGKHKVQVPTAAPTLTLIDGPRQPAPVPTPTQAAVQDAKVLARGAAVRARRGLRRNRGRLEAKLRNR